MICPLFDQFFHYCTRNLKKIALIQFYFESFPLHSLLLGDWSTWAGVLAKGARTDDGIGDEEGDVMAASVVYLGDLCSS